MVSMCRHTRFRSLLIIDVVACVYCQSKNLQLSSYKSKFSVMSNRLSHKLHPLIVDYKQRCMEKRLAPHFAITNSIVGSTLNLSADLILKDEDWDPLLFVLKSSGANLYDITAIHLWSSVGGRYITASVAKPTKSTKLAPVTPPSVTKHKVLLDIFKALAHFMRISPILIELELAGISSISAATLDALAEVD